VGASPSAGNAQAASGGGREHIGFARDVTYVVVAQLSVYALGTLRLPLLSKSLGDELYGTWSLIIITASLLSPLATLGLTPAIVRFLASQENKEKVRNEYLSALLVVFLAGAAVSSILVLSITFLLPSNIVSSSFSDEATALGLGAFLILTQSLVPVTIAYFNTFRQMKWYSLMQAGRAACELTLIACLLHLGWELEGVVVAVLMSGCLTVALSLFVILRQIGFAMPHWPTSAMREYLRYGLPLVPNAMILWVIVSSDYYLVQYFKESGDVGDYAASYNLCNLLLLFFVPVRVVLFPTVSKLYDKGDREKAKNFFRISHKYSMMLAIPAVFGLSILATPVMWVVTAADFISGSEVIPYLACALLAFGFYNICVLTLHVTKRTYWLTRLLGVAAILNIVLNLALIPSMGIVGAAVASLVSYCVLSGLTLIVGFRYFRYELSPLFLLKCVLASTVMLIILRFFDPLGALQILGVVAVGAALYLVIMLALKGISWSELSELTKTVRREP
jgi:O-antigen/teichoic acid export membrane protein